MTQPRDQQPRASRANSSGADAPDATDATRSPHDDDRFLRDLEQAAGGDLEARNRLWSMHYETLRECAKAWFDRNWQQRRRGQGAELSIGGTHIVNVAYERLRDRDAALTKGRKWFFRCFYTECMRIVIEHYRRRPETAAGLSQIAGELAARGPAPSVARVVELISKLEKFDQVTGQIAMLKIFETVPDDRDGQRGLTIAEVAELIGFSISFVEKRWAFAKAWLKENLSTAAV